MIKKNVQLTKRKQEKSKRETNQTKPKQQQQKKQFKQIEDIQQNCHFNPIINDHIKTE